MHMDARTLTGLRRRWLCLLAVLVATIAAWTSAAVARADSYVSLGDSYTAGPLIPNQIGPPFGCLRSDRNYPHLSAGAIGFPLRDPSCSGAKTDHMTQPQNVDPDGPKPPQFNSLDGTTNVVSITIGGNDVGFSEIAQNCTTFNPFGRPCQDRYNSGGVDQIHERIVATAPKVAAVLHGIRARSPAARIFVLNYPAIFPETGFGCWPQMPIAFRDVPYLRAKQRELNQMLATQAAANGATLVNWYAASIGHDACKSSSVRWVEPLVPGNLAASIHPNLRGMQGAANVLVSAVRG
jgi:lysophospholipase L1-like esterase